MRVLRRAVAATVAVVCGLPAAAMAHGDPASHSLESEQLYLSFTAAVSQAGELRLQGYLDAVRRSGYPIKLTVVAGEVDVTDDPAMLYAPQRYAEFVEAQLVEDAQQPVAVPVVVVTPHGIGVAGRAMRDGRFGPVTRAHASALARGIDMRAGARGDDLVTAATTAIRRIARAAGHPLPANVPPAPERVPPPYEPPGDGFPLPALVFGVVFLGAAGVYELRLRWRRSRTTFTPIPRRETR